jgi:uncharacterized protein (DUF488 family)
MKIMTLGYEGLTVDSFFSLLVSHGIQALVDVREMPLSHKPGFSKTALSGWAASYGLRYIHLPALGCPKEIRHAYRVDRDWNSYTRRFLAHLSVQGDAVKALSHLARSERCCLMCFEADHRYCHRSYVADVVAQTVGNELVICHLGAKGTVSVDEPIVLAGKLSQLSAIDLSNGA